MGERPNFVRVPERAAVVFFSIETLERLREKHPELRQKTASGVLQWLIDHAMVEL